MSKWNNAVKTSFSNSGKRVEFSGTEIHFSSDSKKINIRLGSDHQPPPQHLIGSHENLRNGNTFHESTPKKGILKNKIATPDKYYLGQLDEVDSHEIRRKKITHQNQNHVERAPETQLTFDTFNGTSTSSPQSIIESSTLSRSNQRSPAGKANLTSYKLIIDMLHDEKTTSHQHQQQQTMRNDDFLINHKKSDFAQYNRDKIFRPIAKPRKIYPLDAPKINFSTSPTTTTTSIKSRKFIEDDEMMMRPSMHISNGGNDGMKLSGRRFDLARDEKVLNDLINAADEILNQNL